MSSRVSERRRLTLLSYSAMIVLGINVGWLGPFLPQISRTLHASLDQTGLILSAIAAGYFVALPAGGEFGHRRGAHALLTIAMLLDATGCLALALAPTLGLSLCAAAVIGFGQCGIDVATNTLVAELNRDQLPSALNYLHLMFGVGASAGPAIDAVAVAHGVGYAGTFACGAAVIGVVGGILALTPRFESRPDAGVALKLGAMLAQPLIWVISLVLFLYVGAEVGVGAWLFTWFRVARAPLSVSGASLAVSTYWAGLMCGRLLGGRLGRRISALRLAAIGSVVSALALVCLMLAPSSSWLGFAVVWLIGVGYGPVFPNMIAIGAERFPSRVASMMSVVAAGAAVGGVLLPWAMGVALVIGGRGIAIGMALALTLSMTTVLTAMMQRLGTS